jgi:integrase
LRTDSRRAARKLALDQNEKLENYWATLVTSGEKHNEQSYKQLLDRARLLGFSYHPSLEVAALPLGQIIDRLMHLEKEKHYKTEHVEAILGGQAPPELLLKEVLPKFWDLAKDKTLHKSPEQIRKWRNPRIRAMRNFINCVGNKPVHELSREDILRFRNWWIERISKGAVKAGSANKDLIYVKMIITTVADNLNIKLEEYLFRKLLLSEDDAGKRLPFETDYITDVLLKPENLIGLNEQARYALYAFAETGAGASELTGLMPEDIILDHDIPHICIVPRHKKSLKTKFRTRKIPLVGYALEAFKACPDGFSEYRSRADILSNDIGNCLSENNLLPSDQHSAYSLRHSFQDRLLDVNTPDRVQADLMGHKFQRQEYGLGATLAKKLEFLQKIQLKKEFPTII